MSVRSPRRPRPDARAARRAGRRSGFSIVELLLTVAVAGLLIVVAAPRFRAFRESSAVRGARLELATAIEAARGAAIQRSRPARVRIRTDGVLVTVDTGAPAAAATGRFTVLGPLRFDTAFATTITPTVPGDTIIAYDSRGLASPRLGHVARYVIARGAHRDSVCVSNLGMILPRGCTP